MIYEYKIIYLLENNTDFYQIYPPKIGGICLTLSDI